MLAGKGSGSIPSIGDLVLVFLKVCDALSYAHSQGVIHQDIKPENIMVGKFGEVFVIDWGAYPSNSEELSATPIYMSPEQARAELPQTSDDVFCLGATLFHCLTLRFPTDADSFVELIQKKRAGIIDPLTEEECQRVPPPLLAVATKAMAAKPRDRYPTIEAMAQDLKDYAAGKMVGAHSYSAAEFLASWLKRHRHLLLSLLAVLTVLGGSLAYAYQVKIKEMAYWGRPIFEETFSDENWRDDWVTVKGQARLEDGRIVSTSDAEMWIYYKERLYGDSAIEFEGEMLPGAIPCDLSVSWIENPVFGEDGKIEKLGRRYFLQTGAHDNSFAAISRGPPQVVLDQSQFKLKHSRKYKIRAEIRNTKLSLFVDGKLLCHTEVPFPTSAGYIGLYAFYPGKAFDNVKIYSLGVPEMERVTMRGDLFFRKGMYTDAAAEYEQVERSHSGKAIAREATYKLGLTYYRKEDIAEAFRIWNSLRETEWGARVRAHELRELVYANADEALQDKVTGYYRTAGRTERRMILSVWATALSRQLWHNRDPSALLKLREELFPDDHDYSYAYAKALLWQNRYEDVLVKCREHDWACAQALTRLGNFEESLTRYPLIPTGAVPALLNLGQPEEILKRFPNHSDFGAQALIALGRPEEVLERFANESYAKARALLYLGRYQEVIDLAPDTRWAGYAMLELGQLDQAKARFPEAKPFCSQVDHMSALRAHIAGAHRRAAKLLEEARAPVDSTDNMYVFSHHLMWLVIDALGERRYEPEQTLDQRFASCRKNAYCQVLWHDLAYLLGRIDDRAYLAQPWKINLSARHLFIRAVKADLRREAPGKIYKEYLELPRCKRPVDPIRDAFVKWRISRYP